MDYEIWKQIARKMRQQEKIWPTNKRETRCSYVERLRKTALRLSPAFVKKAIGNMKERCRRLYVAQGSHFEEGGQHWSNHSVSKGRYKHIVFKAGAGIIVHAIFFMDNECGFAVARSYLLWKR